MNEKIQKYQELYMDFAERTAKMSYAKRKQVGSVIVKDGRIISMGWNGMPEGWPNECEYITYETQAISTGTFYGQEISTYQTSIPVLKTRPEVLHAEMNALNKLAKSTESSKGASLYITLSPCLECAKSILQTEIKEVFYKEQYRDTSGIDFLIKSGINVTKI